MITYFKAQHNIDMKQGPQNVLDYHGNNTIFTVWNFKET